MPLSSGIGKILAPIFALVAALLALYEFYQLLNRIKMIADALKFIFDTYYSTTQALDSFALWKANVTYQISAPVFNAIPMLEVVPGFFWDLLKLVILICIVLWLLDRL